MTYRATEECFLHTTEKNNSPETSFGESPHFDEAGPADQHNFYQ